MILSVCVFLCVYVTVCLSLLVLLHVYIFVCETFYVGSFLCIRMFFDFRNSKQGSLLLSHSKQRHILRKSGPIKNAAISGSKSGKHCYAHTLSGSSSRKGIIKTREKLATFRETKL